MIRAVSKVQAYLDNQPEARNYITAAVRGDAVNGADLVDGCLSPMIEGVYAQIEKEVQADSLSAPQCRMYIEELSVFARYNSQFLARAATSVEGACFELAHEFRRNHLEEGGERGKIPAHYTLYSGALMSDLGILVNGHVPRPETHVLLTLHDLMVTSHSASTICGGYYATEGVAIRETEILSAITDRFAALERGGADLPALNYYYSLHLDEGHEAATVAGSSVEGAHIEGIAKFIRKADLFGINLAQACDGFLQIFEGMSYWWTELASSAGRIEN